MKHKTWQRAVCALFLIGLAAGCVHSQEKGKDDKSRDGPRMLKVIDPELLARMVDLATTAKTCDTETQLVCVIEMKKLSYQGRDYCVAVAPDIKVKTDPTAGWWNKRRILWKLDTDQLTGDGVVKDLAFHPDAGVVLTVNQFAQLDLWGEVGDGSSSPLQRIFYRTRTLRNKMGASATYLPVILWGKSGEEELCAAIDPKIANI